MERLLTMNKFRLHKIYMNNYKLFDNKNIEFKRLHFLTIRENAASYLYENN